MATERVRGLIETIKDALICAVELHNETVESINESDVELHRRLVQQVMCILSFYFVNKNNAFCLDFSCLLRLLRCIFFTF